MNCHHYNNYVTIPGKINQVAQKHKFELLVLRNCLLFGEHYGTKVWGLGVPLLRYGWKHVKYG